MKLVVAFVQPFMVERVSRMLRQRASMFFISEVRAYYAGLEEPDLCGKCRFEVPVNDENAQPLADLIAQTINTGRAGDGIVMIVELPYAINVDVGRKGAQVLDF